MECAAVCVGFGLRSCCARVVPIVSAAEVILKDFMRLCLVIQACICIGMAASNALSRSR